MPESQLMNGNGDPDIQKDHSVTGQPQNQAQSSTRTTQIGDKFCPYDPAHVPNISTGLPPEIWTIMQSAPANFAPQHFLDTSRNLVENPNLTVSFVARAELSYQSFTDATFNPKAQTAEDLAGIVKHLKLDCRPQLVEGGFEGYELEWTVVRKLIPRNPKVDKPLMQTCHLFKSDQDILVTGANGQKEMVQAERYLVIYIPHISSPEEMPFYHPKVQSLAILYTYLPIHDASSISSPPSPGTMSIYYSLFPDYPLDNRLSRTALKLLDIMHKHSRGRQAGYKKRVHHDQIIGQKRFQDTYAYLKGKYARDLIDGWVEQTPAEKHVFEDLGIAAFLIELWVGMYGPKSAPEEQYTRTEADSVKEEPDTEINEKKIQAQQNFPGFVDIGCGNGLLVYLLNAEGWFGWGFDARARKTWSTFPTSYSSKLQELLLVPRILQVNNTNDDDDNKENTIANAPPSHDGVFNPGTFIISNHADELTPWTPILACLSLSPFIAIPCCSHDFGGTRFRAPVHFKYVVTDPNEKKTQGKNKIPSAYASLCSWVSHLTEEVGYQVEKEFLRIPSTRNMAILGRHWETDGDLEDDMEKRLVFVRDLIEKEMGGATSSEQLWRTWMHRSGSLLRPSSGGH